MKLYRWLYKGVQNMWPFPADPNRKKVIIRTNVLTLMLMAYLTIFALIVIILLCFKAAAATPNAPIGDLLSLLGNALIALIGGTLAISKDLVNDDNKEQEERSENGPENNQETQSRVEQKQQV
ncbi:MAG: hypothetical protein F4234_10425 [Gammaproteobacteria bacterium]|nr:hypothetical protein [Gammaproteobacteria bacterium]MYG95475.1 hypothetical protein [Gammaproteobacteria bacterium]